MADQYNRSTSALAPAVRGPCYDVGDAVTLTFSVTDSSGAPIDPSAASFSVLDPLGTTTPHNWPGDAEVGHSGVGAFSLTLLGTSSGRYHWRASTAGGGSVPAQAVADSFDVAQTPLVPGPAPGH